MVISSILVAMSGAVLQGFGENIGTKMSEAAVGYLQKIIQNKKNGIKEEIEIPETVKIEIEDSFVTYLKSLANPVRIGGVAYFFSEKMSKEDLEEIEAILTEFKGTEENDIANEMEDWYISDRVVCINRDREYMDDIDGTNVDYMAREFAIMINNRMISDVIDSYVFY